MTEEDRARKILASIKTAINKKELIDEIADAIRKHTKQVVKEIHSQAKDKPIKATWLGFKSYL